MQTAQLHPRATCIDSKLPSHTFLLHHSGYSSNEKDHNFPASSHLPVLKVGWGSWPPPPPPGGPHPDRWGDITRGMGRLHGAMPRVLLLLFILSSITMMFIAHCGISFDSPENRELPPPGVRRRSLEVQDGDGGRLHPRATCIDSKIPGVQENSCLVDSGAPPCQAESNYYNKTWRSGTISTTDCPTFQTTFCNDYTTGSPSMFGMRRAQKGNQEPSSTNKLPQSRSCIIQTENGSPLQRKRQHLRTVPVVTSERQWSDSTRKESNCPDIRGIRFSKESEVQATRNHWARGQGYGRGKLPWTIPSKSRHLGLSRSLDELLYHQMDMDIDINLKWSYLLNSKAWWTIKIYEWIKTEHLFKEIRSLQSSFPAKSYTGATSITLGRETMFADSESPWTSCSPSVARGRDGE